MYAIQNIQLSVRFACIAFHWLRNINLGFDTSIYLLNWVYKSGEIIHHYTISNSKLSGLLWFRCYVFNFAFSFFFLQLRDTNHPHESNKSVCHLNTVENTGVDVKTDIKSLLKYKNIAVMSLAAYFHWLRLFVFFFFFF